MSNDTEAPSEWSGAVPFVTMAQNAAGIDGMPWGDEFLAWYKPGHWFGEHRACAVFVGEKLAALAEIERLRAELKTRHGLQHEAEALAGKYLLQRDDERERCAMKLQVTRADVSLAAGEMSAQEWRTVAAVLRWMQDRIRGA